MHTEVYTDSLLNQELHPVFPETIGESTKQSTLDYLQHHQRSDLDPLKTHTSFGSAQNTTKNLDLDNLKNTQHFSASHTGFLQSTKALRLLQKDLKSIQDENPIPPILDPSKLQLFKSKISEKLKYVFLLLNLNSCLLHKLNKLFIAFKDWSKHLKLKRNQL